MSTTTTEFLKNRYGIEDDNFTDFINNNTATFREIINHPSQENISKEKVINIYNKYVYYNSIGINNSSIRSLLLNDIKNSFADSFPIKPIFSNNSFFDVIKHRIVVRGNTATVSISMRIKKALTENLDILDYLPVNDVTLYIPNIFPIPDNTNNCCIIDNGKLTLPKEIGIGYYNICQTYTFRV